MFATEIISNMKFAGHNDRQEHSIQVQGIIIGTIGYPQALEAIKAIVSAFGLSYLKPEKTDQNHWYGTASPLISIINMFKAKRTKDWTRLLYNAKNCED